MAKLKNIIQEVFEELDVPKVNRYEVIESVSNYGVIGKQLYNENNIIDIAEQLVNIAESAHSHILGEQDDWFDKVSVNKNMKTLKGSVVEFKKTAKEAHALNQRLTGLYEDIGHVLNRYYDIKEAMDPVGKEDGDIDNDGDMDSSDDYLRKRRMAVKKAMTNELEENLKSSDIGKSDNKVSDKAMKTDSDYDPKAKYKYNEDNVPTHGSGDDDVDAYLGKKQKKNYKTHNFSNKIVQRESLNLKNLVPKTKK